MHDYDNRLLSRLQPKRERCLILAASLERLGITNWAPLVRDCGTWIGIADDDQGEGHIVEANFCTHRLCPACNWRRGLRIYSTTSRILDYIDAQENKAVKYLFLTLTVKNCQIPDLSEAIDQMAQAFNRLQANRAWKRRVLGSMRTLEVTINREDMTAHPHYHLILAVPRSYGSAGDPLYWSHDQWQAAWRTACRLDYDPQVSIQVIKGGRKAGIREVAKYMAKDSDYLIDASKAHMGTEEAEALTDYLVRQLGTQLKGRRLVSYTGILRKAQQALKLADPEAAPLVDTIRGDVNQAIRRYKWHAGLSKYVETEGRG